MSNYSTVEIISNKGTRTVAAPVPYDSIKPHEQFRTAPFGPVCCKRNDGQFIRPDVSTQGCEMPADRLVWPIY